MGWEQLLETVFGTGREPRDYNALQMTMRGLVVFLAGLPMVRLAVNRFFARKSAFDLVLSFILASVLARAINGSAPLGPTLLTGVALVLFHRLLALLACRYPWFSSFIKGHEYILIKNGRIRQDQLKQLKLSEGDLMEDLHLNGVPDEQHVAIARMERSGDISIVKK